MRKKICKHRKFIFNFTIADGDAWWFNVNGISKKCIDCDKRMGYVSFEEIENDQDVLKAIFDLIIIN